MPTASSTMPPGSFDPASDRTAYRQALGQFATGVTVITAVTPTGSIGITANSFASVSLEPPLVLWSPDKASRRHAAFVGAEHFAIHVLANDQKNICDAFVRSQNGFEGLDVERRADGLVLIQNCLARFECTRVATHDAGDHTIIVGKVGNAMSQAGEPLVFHGGQFAGLGQ